MLQFKLIVALMFLAVAFQTPAAKPTNSPPADEYEFVPDPSQWVMVLQNAYESIGKLDAAGNFLPDERWLRRPQGSFYFSTPPVRLINPPERKGVYEFRSGRLMKGDFDKGGNFIPEVGSKVIDFKDYHYSKTAPVIYNLPGRFVKKGSKEDSK